MPHDCWVYVEAGRGTIRVAYLEEVWTRKWPQNGVAHLPTGDVASDFPFHAKSRTTWPVMDELS